MQCDFHISLKIFSKCSDTHPEQFSTPLWTSFTNPSRSSTWSSYIIPSTHVAGRQRTWRKSFLAKRRAIQYLSPCCYRQSLGLYQKNTGDTNFSVTDALPELRSFHFYLWDVFPTEVWWRDLIRSAPHLTFLKASIRVPEVNNLEVKVNELELSCIQLPHILSRLPLEYMSLRFCRSDLPWGLAIDPNQRSSRTDEAVALAYAKSIPTLEYFDIEGHQYRNQIRYWRVIRESADNDTTMSVRVRELDEEDGVNARFCFDWKLSWSPNVKW